VTAEGPVGGALRRFRDRVVTTDAVYGTILFAALVAVASVEDEPDDGVTIDLSPGAIDAAGSLTVLLVAVGSLLAFFVAHVYARTIAGHGVRQGREVRVGESFRRAVRVSSGMLLAAVPSVLLLVLGALGILPDAADCALLVAIVVLFALGYQALAERRAPIWQRLVSGLVSALLGVVVIAIDVLAH
jgi:hypothetical protein